MTNTANFRVMVQPQCDNKLEQIARPTHGSPSLAPAFNDNFSCFEQYVFERAVMRELSGDVDF